MSDTTKIQWCDATFNPWIGCTKVSPGCKNCYAEQTTRARVLRSQGRETWGPGAQRSRTSAATWRNPVKWDRDADQAMQDFHQHSDLHGGLPHYEKPSRPRIFPSLCDWLDPEVPIEWLADFLKLIYDTPNLDWLLLTKRPELFRQRIFRDAFHYSVGGFPKMVDKDRQHALSGLANWIADWRDDIDEPGHKPPHNVWLGVSVENQAMADQRIPELLKIPAKVRFLSVEPMLEEIRFRTPADFITPAGTRGIHWVIFGGESGPFARPCNVEWIRDGVRQCKAAGVAAFVKQLGSNPINSQLSTLNHPKGGDMSEWPEDLRVRQFPRL